MLLGGWMLDCLILAVRDIRRGDVAVVVSDWWLRTTPAKTG